VKDEQNLKKKEKGERKEEERKTYVSMFYEF
jgi:hypothetical protein